MSDSPKPYPIAEVEARLAAELPGWSYRDGSIQRQFATAGWKGAIMLTGVIGHLAEAAWHHPDLEVSWGGVLVKLATHSAGGITDLDFALAARIEEIVLWQPGKDQGPLPGTPDDPRYTYIKYPD